MGTKWTLMSRDAAESLAARFGGPVVFVADAVNGFARPLRDGESQAEAVADFELAGEPAVSAEVIG